MKTVTLYTDGACSGNPGPGGWAAILMFGAHKKELSGGERETTNNRMELTAVIRGLGQGLAGPGLGQERQKARPEPGPVGKAAGAVPGASGESALGQGPRLQPLQQPLRRAGGGPVAAD